MPLFDYECGQCGKEFEKVVPLETYNKIQLCPNCGTEAKKVIIAGSGGIQRTGDSVNWVRDAAKFLTDNDRPNPNINTIQDLRHYYKTHPNIVPASSHPALPSSLGDALDSRPDPKVQKAKRSKEAHEKLRKLRAIEVSGRP
jgi:putative FmdB family regulatory protein